MSANSQTTSFGPLLEKWLEGRLTSKEATALNGILSSSEEAFQTYLAMVDMHVALEASFMADMEPGVVRRRTGRRGSWWKWTAAAAAAALILATAWIVWPMLSPTRLPVVATIESGRVGASAIRGDHGFPLMPGMALHAGDILTVPENGKLEIACADRTATYTILPGTRIRLEGNVRGKQIHVFHGKIRCRIDTQAMGRSFLVRTANAEIRVIGTRFLLKGGTETTNLEVEEGRVKLARLSDGKSIEVPAGYSATVQEGLPLVATNTAEKPKPLYEKARAHWQQGELALAETALRKALARAPGYNLKKWCISRLAHVLFEQGDYSGAIRMWDQTIALGYNVPYAHLETHIVECLQGSPSAGLAAYRATWTSENWPAPAIDMFLGKTTPEQVIAAAEQGHDRQLKGRRSSARYYVAEYYLLKGDLTRAKTYFRKAAEIKTDWTDPVTARHRLEQLEAGTLKIARP